MKRIRIAIYMRISKEDAGEGRSDKEGGSIRMQRLLLKQYVEEHFEVYDLEEYQDV